MNYIIFLLILVGLAFSGSLQAYQAEKIKSQRQDAQCISHILPPLKMPILCEENVIFHEKKPCYNLRFLDLGSALCSKNNKQGTSFVSAQSLQDTVQKIFLTIE